MTLYHFGNCVALAYVPYYLTYKYSGLSEYGAFWKCFQSGGMYVLTQLIKMIMLATFFPTQDERIPHGHLDLFGDISKLSMNICDLVGMYIILNKFPGKGHAKVLVVGLGWATAELVFTHFLTLWVGARGQEFDWQYIQKSFDANISLIHHITSSSLLWLLSRRSAHPPLLPMVLFLLLLCNYKPLLLDLITATSHLNSWTVIIVKCLSTIVIGIAAMHIYAGTSPTVGLY